MKKMRNIRQKQPIRVQFELKAKIYSSIFNSSIRCEALKIFSIRFFSLLRYEIQFSNIISFFGVVAFLLRRKSFIVYCLARNGTVVKVGANNERATLVAAVIGNQKPHLSLYILYSLQHRWRRRHWFDT